MSLSKQKDSRKNQHIQVYVRCRPINSAEKSTSFSVVEVCSELKEIRVQERNGGRECTKVFKFDKVFGPSCGQDDIYKTVMNPVIEEVLMGYNCTVFVYGQTGSGKTYTMEGDHNLDISAWDKHPKIGIIPRALSHLFDELEKQDVEFTLHISFLELYNEELFDLLSPETSNLKLRLFEDATRKGSVVIQGLEEISVHSRNEVYKILERGSAKRKTAATMLNATSSRSHTVFSITMHVKETTNNGDELLKTGKLNLVDLAGSENIGRSGAIDGRAREAGNINQSLLTLGRVITSLVEKAPHIPYRESKLTRLLQDSLGGRTKTSIIATISPAQSNVEETLSTLDYAHRAKKITNCPEINQKMTKQALLKEYTQEIERLRRDLAAARERNGIFVDATNYENMQHELSRKSESIKELVSEIEALKEQMEKVNALFIETQEHLVQKASELEKCNKDLEEKEGELTVTTQKLKNTEEKLNKTEIEKAEQQYLAEQRAKTEKELVSHAQKLIEVADESTGDVNALHAKLDRKHSVEIANEQHTMMFRNKFQQSMRSLEGHLLELSEKQTENNQKLHDSINKTLKLYEENSVSLSKMMASFIAKHSDLIKKLSNQWIEQGKFREKWSEEVVRAAQELMESAVNHCNNSISNELMPLFGEIINTHQLMENDMCNLRELICKEKDQQEVLIKQYVNKFNEEINNFEKLFHCMNEETTKQLVECSESAQYIADTYAGILQEYEKKSVELEEIVNYLNETVMNFKIKVDESSPQLINIHQQLLSSSNDHKNELESYLEKLTDDSRTFESTVDNQAKEFVKVADSQIHKMNDVNKEIMNMYKHLKSDFVTFGNQIEKNWEDNVDYIKKNMKEHSECEKENMNTNLNSLKDLTDTAQDMCKSQDDILNKQKEEFEMHILSQKTEVSMIEDIVKHDAQSLVGKVSECGKEFESYLSSWKKDVPSGETPQRKEYSYPRVLPVTSPEERILRRFRTTLKESNSNVHSAIPIKIEEEFNADNENEAKPLTEKKFNLTDAQTSQKTVKIKHQNGKENSGTVYVNK
ncbi:kinesin-like protein KIF11 [Centruroides vittatus]|uniref:kinesin-like protein KIF11 n=1 Tax=Centruroides vittatus TaxID=120091 RepID=UPI00351040BE